MYFIGGTKVSKEEYDEFKTQQKQASKIAPKYVITYDLYDPRYPYSPNDAICYCCCETLEEAKSDKKNMFPGAVIVEETCIEKEIKGERVLEVINSKIID